ncbi:PAS domain-containing hybrid sensor histidine kinase/response regulator [Telluria beijingensis]|uniref:PAS domain-containing hybrid sensor histidine kinase/response regulator n=1 Tax=Telluria beijingensis TaxID=3068633 RepID=UPI00279522A3|nr:ATP-binding protein [Massilia sp. REN29]
MLSFTLFESVFNSSPFGHYLLSPTPDAIILAVNDAFLTASSRTREELVGVSLFLAFPGNPDDPHDTGEANLRASLARVRETGRPDTLPAVRYPIPVLLPNGETVFEERFWTSTSTPIFGPGGELACISHSNSDVTDQVRSQAAVRESEKRFRALTNATAEVIYRMSPDWTQLRHLEGRGFLKDTADTNRFWLEEYIPPEDHDRLHQAIARAIRERSVFELEHRVRRADGSHGWTLSRAVPMLDAGGRVYEWIGAASDITERKAAEEKLREADRRKDEFLAMLAHELRNPLAPIGAAAELLQRMKLDEAIIKRTSQIIGRQVGHMTALIDDLLDVSRVTRGLVELDTEPLDVGAVLHEAVEQVMPLIQQRRHDLALRLPPPGTSVAGDRKRLVQVVANLLNNAAKYTPEGGRLEVGSSIDAERRLCIDVSDDGIGMAPDLTARVFELFAQAERSSDRSSGGLGLGLALVKSLVELHGGTVACDSAGPGRGSRFSVCLPLLERGADAPAQCEEQLGAGQPGSLRVMVVDDNVDAAVTLSMLLESAGHRVVVEHGALQALERARQFAPQVCLLDIGLPGIDGLELARRLRALPHTEHVLLVAVTGYGQERDREQILAAGFDHHLVKPIDTGRLYALLDGVGAPAA